MSTRKQEILLTHGSYLGTLAAARYYGRQGHHVIVADHGTKSPAQHSRHVAEGLEFPDELDFAAIADWLEAFGRKRPGSLLYPCSDDMAWVLAGNCERLTPYFVMLQPGLATIEALLNKHKLYELCRQLDIPTPETVYPRNAEDVVAMVGRLAGKFLVKPKTQIGLKVKNKAAIADAGPALISACQDFQRNFRYVDAMTRHDPALLWPMIQRFDPAASTRTVSIAGFRSRDGRYFQVLSSQKILQFPIRIGVGLCFSSIDIKPELAERVRRICEATGYYGAFEVEFIRSDAGDLLMDFNPRYYGQMQLEISRGLPIPALVACDALKQPFPVLAPARNLHIAHRWQLKVVMTTQAIAGRITWSERRRWLDLTDRRKNPDVVDSVRDRDDPAPWYVTIRRQLFSYVRHPRATFRALFGNA